ncbi:MAG: XrtA/PEP-CTERM system histidine kinase PrsK [Alphaproteobacteria bacterium]
MSVSFLDSLTQNIGTFNYSISAVTFVLLTVLLFASWKRGWVGAWLIAASVLTAAWSVVTAYSYTAGADSRLASDVLEILRGAGWLMFLAGVLSKTWDTGRHRAIGRFVVPAIAVFSILIVSIDCVEYTINADVAGAVGLDLAILGRLVIAVVGILLIENLYRNTKREHRWGIKYVCFGIGGMFAYEFFMFADGLLFQSVNQDLVDARGIVNAVIAHLIAVSAARNPDWSIDVAVSRRVIFHSATLIGAGIYLLLMAAAGFYLREFGGQWGPAVQVVFLFAAIVLLVLTLFSGSFRAWVKVNINKYFFTYRYDYREEWLRLIRTISSVGSGRDLAERVIKGLADIVESPEGTLWLYREPDQFELRKSYNSRVVEGTQTADPKFAQFLEDRQWVINLDEFRENPALYDDLMLPEWLRDTRDDVRAWLVVPLLHHDRLMGILMLGQPRVLRELNWEDYDLLKTVGRQSASYLSEHESASALAEAKQFDEFNRRFAFVLHDIKNLVSQLSLMVKNAEKHKNNPAFQEDMLQTVSESVEKMNNLLVRLHEGGRQAAASAALDLSLFLRQIVEHNSRADGRLSFEDDVAGIAVVIDEERLGAVMAHVIDNALDAIEGDGSIAVRLGASGSEAVIEVEDNGCGMTAEFIRDELFKPFRTSKGGGYGIGAFESREYVRENGGRMDVESEPGSGTKVTIRLPALSRTGGRETGKAAVV